MRTITISKFALSIGSFALYALATIAPAPADLRSSMDETRRRGAWCAEHEKNVADAFATHADPADDPGWAASLKSYDRNSRAEQECDGHDDYVNAYLAAWQGQILHHQGSEWKTKMDLANQLLDQCATKNAGTPRGDQCAADLKANTVRMTSWQSQ
jgi:hypothetical protein